MEEREQGLIAPRIPVGLYGELPSGFPRDHRVVPVGLEGGVLVLVSDVPTTERRRQELRFFLGSRAIRLAEDWEYPEHRANFASLLDEYDPLAGE